MGAAEARRLLELGSDVHAATPRKCSDLDMAARAGAQEAVQLQPGAMSGMAAPRVCRVPARPAAGSGPRIGGGAVGRRGE